MCGSHKNLEIDHIDPTGKITSKMWHYGKAFRARELAKCQVLCRPCHVLKSVGEQGFDLQGPTHLPDATVRAIREMKRDENLGYKRISKRLGLSPWRVKTVLQGRSYRHVIV